MTMSISKLAPASFALFISLAPLGCIAEQAAPEPAEHVAETGMSFEEFMTYVYQEPDTGIYIADGDTPFETLDELKVFWAEHFQDGALIINLSGGADDRWSDAQKLNLTYCVSKNFGANYATVVQAMASATGAWQSAANVKFVYLSAQDSSCGATNKNVVFDVSPVNVNGQYLARSFFPHQSRASRNILIDNSAFTVQSPSVAGVLRHELGHTLGFRHEHTRPEAGVCFEDNSWRVLTPYDSGSVMHYPQCNGSNSWALNLTSLDKSGAASVYGAPGGGGKGGK